MAKAPPKSIQLSNEQRLGHQNIMLRNVLLDQERAKLQAELGAWQAGVEKQHRCYLKDYGMDASAGVLTLRPKPHVVTAQKKEATDA